jgi:hypothetical protein
MIQKLRRIRLERGGQVNETTSPSTSTVEEFAGMNLDLAMVPSIAVAVLEKCHVFWFLVLGFRESVNSQPLMGYRRQKNYLQGQLPESSPSQHRGTRNHQYLEHSVVWCKQLLQCNV